MSSSPFVFRPNTLRMFDFMSSYWKQKISSEGRQKLKTGFAQLVSVYKYLLWVILEQLIAVIPRQDQQVHITVWPRLDCRRLRNSDKEGQLTQDRGHIGNLDNRRGSH